MPALKAGSKLLKMDTFIPAMSKRPEKWELKQARTGLNNREQERNDDNEKPFKAAREPQRLLPSRASARDVTHSWPSSFLPFDKVWSSRGSQRAIPRKQREKRGER
jgi:hypothetical protein